MVDIAVLFGAERNASLKELKETLELEMRIANVSCFYFNFCFV